MRVLLLVFSLILGACTPKVSGKIDSRPKLGIDPTWSPLEFGAQGAYINGFTDELMREIASSLDIEFNKLHANPGDLLSGLEEGTYDVVLSSLPTYTFNLAKYDFSKNFLEIGPVFIVPKNAPYKKISQLQHQYVGVIAGSKSIELLAKYPKVRVRKYLSGPDLLNGIVSGEVAGGLLARVPASAYVSDLYQEKLKIVSSPLTGQGLHLVALKNSQEDLMQGFDESLKTLKRKKRLEELLKKWSLAAH